MTSESDLTLGEALAQFRATNGLRSDEAAARSWTCRIGPVALRLPNFAWRRRAVAAHDVHHILTGYPCTTCGEFQMATWEFAAGRMPHWAAALFCLPLVALGMLWSPRRMWRAFRAGRHATSLHAFAAIDHLLGTSVQVTERVVTARRPTRHVVGDALRFAILVAAASLLVLAPVMVTIALVLMSMA